MHAVLYLLIAAPGAFFFQRMRLCAFLLMYMVTRTHLHTHSNECTFTQLHTLPHTHTQMNVYFAGILRGAEGGSAEKTLVA
jgi:hypothetical protein